MTDNEKSLAEQMWEAEIKVETLKYELEEFILKPIFQTIPEYTTDWYDSSIEIYNCKIESLTEAQQRLLFDFGFWVVWTHTAAQRGGTDIEYKYTQGDKTSHTYLE